MYLTDPDALKTLPAPVLNQLGDPEPALTFDLTPDRKLGSEDANEVLANLSNQGFHLQMPRDIEETVARISEEAHRSTGQNSGQNNDQATRSPGKK